MIREIRSDIWGAPSPSPKIWWPKNMKFRRDFGQLSPLDREYLRNATRHHQSENGVVNYGHSRTCKLNSVYFVSQTVKNMTRVLTHPPAIVQRSGVNKSVAFARWQHVHPTGGRKAGHCHASSWFFIVVHGGNVDAQYTSNHQWIWYARHSLGGQHWQGADELCKYGPPQACTRGHLPLKRQKRVCFALSEQATVQTCDSHS